MGRIGAVSPLRRFAPALPEGEPRAWWASVDRALNFDFMLASPIFTVRKRLSFCRVETCRGHVLGKYDSRQEKTSTFLWRFMLALPVFTARKQLSFCR